MNNNYATKYYGITIILSSFNMIQQNIHIGLLFIQIGLLIDIFTDYIYYKNNHSGLASIIIFITILCSIYKIVK